MPRNNQFRHQPYPTEPSVSPVVRKLVHKLDQLPDFGRIHSALAVRQVLLVHGTFAGSDPFGIQAMLNGQIDRTSPSTRLALKPIVEKLSDRTKRITDVITGDVSNYTDEFRAAFQDLVGDDPVVSRLEPTWSSENHHLARAGLAVRLLCWLEDCRLRGLDPEGDRVMLWGHSHAGNGFAILTNLLANDRGKVRAFFGAVGNALGELGQRARAILESAPSPHPLAQALLLVTFGTPVRYGWDTNGYRQLLHVTHHRTIDEEHPERTVPAFTYGCQTDGKSNSIRSLQKTIFDILAARYGDWVQTFAIAGTDLPPVVHRAENRALRQLLETGLPEPTPDEFRDRFQVLCKRWKTATRLHSDGRNLLVEFEPTRMTRFGPAHQSIFGHGVYTRMEWLPAQLALIMEWLERDGEG